MINLCRNAYSIDFFFINNFLLLPFICIYEPMDNNLINDKNVVKELYWYRKKSNHACCIFDRQVTQKGPKMRPLRPCKAAANQLAQTFLDNILPPYYTYYRLLVRKTWIFVLCYISPWENNDMMYHPFQILWQRFCIISSITPIVNVISVLSGDVSIDLSYLCGPLTS